MKMTLEEAKYCLVKNSDCCKCKHYHEYGCFDKVKEIAVTAINYLIVGKRLAEEAEDKER